MFILLLILPEGLGQLTQSLGWGSAGSPGKRGAGLASAEEDIGCEFDTFLLRDIMYLIQVKKIRYRWENFHNNSCYFFNKRPHARE